MRRLLGHMVTRNEEHRYLRHSLRSLRLVCDDIAVFDDASTDHTVDVALAEGAHCESRDIDEVGFADHEGRFRQLAWDYMEETLHPEDGDWILSLDADEVLVCNDGAIATAVRGCVDALPPQPPGSPPYTVIGARVAELWQIQPPMVRIDGFWATIGRATMRAWAPNLRFPDRALASGSVPGATEAVMTDQFRIGHLGHLRDEDRREKYERYLGRRGHNQTHVRSIIAKPQLAPLEGILP